MSVYYKPSKTSTVSID